MSIVDQIKFSIKKLKPIDIIMFNGFLLAFFMYYVTEIDYYRQTSVRIAQFFALLYMTSIVLYLWKPTKTE